MFWQKWVVCEPTNPKNWKRFKNKLKLAVDTMIENLGQRCSPILITGNGCFFHYILEFTPSYNYLRESKTSKSRTTYIHSKGFGWYIYMNFSDQGKYYNKLSAPFWDRFGTIIYFSASTSFYQAITYILPIKTSLWFIARRWLTS